MFILRGGVIGPHCYAQTASGIGLKFCLKFYSGLESKKKYIVTRGQFLYKSHFPIKVSTGGHTGHPAVSSNREIPGCNQAVS